MIFGAFLAACYLFLHLSGTTIRYDLFFRIYIIHYTDKNAEENQILLYSGQMLVWALALLIIVPCYWRVSRFIAVRLGRKFHWKCFFEGVLPFVFLVVYRMNRLYFDALLSWFGDDTFRFFMALYYSYPFLRFVSTTAYHDEINAAIRKLFLVKPKVKVTVIKVKPLNA